MKVEIYSDVVCPWCYIGTRRFRRVVDEWHGSQGVDDVEIVQRPFQLDPTTPDTPVPSNQRLIQKFGPGALSMQDRLAEQARGEGIEMRFDLALSVNSLSAHRLAWLALTEHSPDVQWRVEQALFDAHFTRGLNVADHAVLRDIAAGAGIDADRATAYLASDEGAEDVGEALREASEIGVTSVPTFVFEGKWAVVGAQPAELMTQALDQVAKEIA